MDYVTSNKSFIDSLVSDVPQKTLERQELDRQIREHIKKYGKIYPVGGALGEGAEGCDAFVKQITRTDNGVFTEFYGCSYLYKGEIDSVIIDQLATAKRAFISTLRLIKFPNKKVIFKWIESVYDADLIKKQPPIQEFCASAKEFIRVGLIFLPEKVVYFFAMILQFDNAYRFRFQDIVSEIKKDNLGIKEIQRLFTLFLERENSEGVRDKLLLIRRFIPLLYLSLKLYRFIKDFVLELDLDKIRPDESDRYFMLNRVSYDFFGIPYEERLKEWHRINEEKGHIIIV